MSDICTTWTGTNLSRLWRLLKCWHVVTEFLTRSWLKFSVCADSLCVDDTIDNNIRRDRPICIWFTFQQDSAWIHKSHFWLTHLPWKMRGQNTQRDLSSKASRDCEPSFSAAEYSPSHCHSCIPSKWQCDVHFHVYIYNTSLSQRCPETVLQTNQNRQDTNRSHDWIQSQCQLQLTLYPWSITAYLSRPAIADLNTMVSITANTPDSRTRLEKPIFSFDIRSNRTKFCDRLAILISCWGTAKDQQLYCMAG